MIIRISGEGQYNLSGAYLDELNELDNRVVDVVGDGNREEFHRVFAQMLELVRQKGNAVPIDELVESDLVLPSPDTTMEEAKELFTGEGLIPG